jgi:hypothetical protein
MDNNNNIDAKYIMTSYCWKISDRVIPDIITIINDDDSEQKCTDRDLDRIIWSENEMRFRAYTHIGQEELVNDPFVELTVTNIAHGRGITARMILQCLYDFYNTALTTEEKRVAIDIARQSPHYDQDVLEFYSRQDVLVRSQFFKRSTELAGIYTDHNNIMHVVVCE